MFKIFKNVIENSDFDLRDILKKIEELDLKEEEREFILNNIKICSKIYARGINDYILSIISYVK